MKWPENIFLGLPIQDFLNKFGQLNLKCMGGSFEPTKISIKKIPNLEKR